MRKRIMSILSIAMFMIMAAVVYAEIPQAADVLEVSVEKSMTSASMIKAEDFENAIEYGENGYMGTLTRDDGTFTIESTATENVSKTVTETKRFTNLSRNDMAEIPKSRNGLSLFSVEWADGLTGQSVKGFTAGMPGPYTAVAHYRGVKTFRVTTEYTANITYSGAVSKIPEADTDESAPTIPAPLAFLLGTLGVFGIGGLVWYSLNKNKRSVRR